MRIGGDIMADETRKFEALDADMRVLIKNLDGLMRVGVRDGREA